ncbi:Dipeptidyl aminopeptidase/acylaminoacyl peptidase [Pseudoxanthomonas wuyuanensis]|uniref:Dipeptidyl aminopeptidase/acylaminoacyl peptidase n=2 Tax=Pseudoxanthomonas wuyuanensis TaxID=1073196 RepID=A0A286DBF5_9GAMM|nr:Dipeptidyl aminopeptidase/acylaminoacyl peptidase [Pseudoxanthomonas wuyuanensis]
MHWGMRVGMLAAWLAPLAVQAQQVDLAAYLKQDKFERVKISPSGAYYAATMPLEDRTALVVIRRSDMSGTAKITGREDSAVDDFWWANDERIVVAMARKEGSRDEPVTTGELHAIDADGKGAKLLASPLGVNDGPHGSGVKFELDRAVFMEDTLPSDPNSVLVSAVPLESDPSIRIEKLNIYTRRRSVVASVPVRRASFTVDAEGRVRFARGANADNVSKLYYRDDDKAPWRLINDEAVAQRREFPMGFSADGKIAYLQVEQAQGPDAVMAWDPATGVYTELMRDALVDPFRTLYDMDGRTPIGVSFMTDRVRNRFFDEKSATARLYRSLEKSFKEEVIYLTSATSDGKLALFYVWSDRNNGDYFLFDAVNKTADRVFSRREWFHPSRVPPTRAVALQARDGTPLNGYLTLPFGAKEGARPMVLLPHGGPFGIFDQWNFDDDTQILAEAGYAVLRVNYRGSGNYGRALMQAGAQEWGGRMQDDLTDATRWAIEQGIADPSRICIYGASYGGYAALMGVAKEPDLYRCAAGYVGVYDLALMHRGQSRRSRSGKTWAGDWLGAPETLAARSPSKLAERIKVPVFLAAGGKDERAPIAHSERMEKALKAAGVPVETLYFPYEGHGFYTESHRREYYTRLLAFLGRHLGGGTAK